MTIDKRVNYDMQGHKKPARNYLGKQKTVKNIPIKWKSGPKAPETELAYITKAEKNLLLKKDLHGSLKHGPNTGPDGIMSLDSQGDYTRDRSPAGRQSSPGGPDRSRQGQAQHEQNMREILTGQKNIGQTAAVSARTRRGAVPEWVNTPDGPKYVGSSTKGKQGWFNKLLGRGNVRGLKGIQLRGTPGQRGFEYFSEDEDVGDIKPGFGGRILGGLAGLATGIPFVGPMIGGAIDKYKPKGYFEGLDPSEQRRLNALNLTPLNEQKISLQNDVPMARTDRWTTPAVTGTGQNFDYRNALGEYDLLGNANTNTGVQRQNFNMALPIGSAEGGRIGYQGGELVEDASMMEATPAGMMEENIEEVQGEPSREQLEAIAFQIFRLPLEELDEQQLMVVYQAAMEQEPSEEEVQFAAQEGPPEGIASLV